jgi:SAM-dependent methyltransferase
MLDVLGAKIATASVANMEPLELDLERDPLPDRRYNLIYTLNALHHIPDTASILKMFYELLTRPGYLCIGDLDREDGSFHSGEFHGHHGFDQNELAGLCRSVGFWNVDSSNVFTMVKLRGQERKEYPLFLMCAEKR